MVAATQPAQESLIAGRTIRVAVGEEARIVEVQAGEPWPADAICRIDLLIRTGNVIRFDENGELDRRSQRFARRFGLDRKPKPQFRSFTQRARGLAQTIQFRGRQIRVFAGRPDGDERELFVYRGRAFGLRRGAPDPAGDPSLRSRGPKRKARRPGKKKSGTRRRRIEA